MARIIGGIGTSHVPTIAMAFDKGKRDDPDWKPLFQGYERVARWLEEKRPDVLFFCFNDHATSFFFDHYPTFALGVSDQYVIADDRHGIRQRKARRPGLEAAVPGLRARGALARGKAPRRALLLLQRPRHELLLRPLPDLRAWRERPVRDRRRRPGPAPDPSAQGPGGPPPPHCAFAGRRGVRHFGLSGHRDRPRAALAAHHDVAVATGVAGPHGAARRERDPAAAP